MDLVARIVKLEKDNRRYQLTSIMALALLLGAAVLMGAQRLQPQPQMVVQEIVFTDEQGKPLWKMAPKVEGANTTAAMTKLVFSSTFTSHKGEFGEIASLLVRSGDSYSRSLTFPDSQGEATLGILRGARGTIEAGVRFKAYERDVDLSAKLSEAGLHVHSMKGKGSILTRLDHQSHPEIMVENSQGGSLFQVKE